MRVAMVIQSFAPVLGGAQRQVEALGPHLGRLGVGASVITRRPPGTPAYESRPGLSVHRVSAGSGGVASLSYTLRGASRTMRIRPDVIHAHDLLSPSTVALLASTVRRVPVIVKILQTGPGGDIDRLARKPLGARRLAAICARFDGFICLSKEIEQELRSLGFPSERLWRIPNGVDADCYRPSEAGERESLRTALGLPLDQTVALFAGRLYASKRVDVLIRAMQRAPGVLVVAGEGPQERRLRRLTEELGLAKRVDFRGTVEDTAPLYRAADLYLSASAAEGMSNSVLEAMATGLPVVATQASGIDDQLGEGAGILLRRTDPALFAETLEKLAGDPGARERVGRAARERAVRRYSLEAVAEALAKLYRAVLAVPR